MSTPLHRLTVVALFALALFALALLACPEPVKCVDCAGCCDEKGLCYSGDLHEACGGVGQACMVCSADQACVGATCVASAAGGGSSGGGGGGGSGSGSGGGGGGTIDTNPFVTAHNAARAQAMPAPSPALPLVTWNTTVEASAQAWADGCRFMHDGANSTYGENLYAGTGTPTPEAIVTSWVSEKSNYNYAANSCTGVCGHYTQVVWRSSTRLGCAIKECSTNSPFSGFPRWFLAVCRYSDPGNYVGQRPY